jgi:NitT/TauT family transport system substrate-binding protein
VFDSTKVPGEIIDMMVVRTGAPETLKKALTGAWYEVMQVMTRTDKAAGDAIAWMAKSSGATVPEFRAQLGTTAMFYKASDAVAFATGSQLPKTMDYVRTFSFSKGLFGQRARNKDFVGIAFPDSSVLGDPKNVKLRFTAEYMKQAAEDKL